MRRPLVVAVTALVLAAGGCSGGKKSPPKPLAMATVAHTVAGVPLLHWTGSWKAYGQSLTLDLRTMGNGDAVGTVKDGADSAQVLVADGKTVLLKGGRGYWKHDDGGDTARYAGRWVDEGGSVWGLRPGDLDKIWNSVPGSVFKIAYWREDHQVANVAEQEPFNPAPLLTELTTRAAQ